MTSKSPVRSCEDVDETALSYAEIKALCAGNPLIKERMDLEIEVSRLRLLKSEHQNQHYRLEDNLLRFFPEGIERDKGYISAFERDIELFEKHTPETPDTFPPMVIHSVSYTDKGKAGAALLEACKNVSSVQALDIGSYRGFDMSLSFNSVTSSFKMTLKGAMSHSADLGTDAYGNITRINNALADMPNRLQSVRVHMENLVAQMENAKHELQTPFPYEQELAEKSARLALLDAELNIGGGTFEIPGEICDTDDELTEPESEVAKNAKISILGSIKAIKEKLADTPGIIRNRDRVTGANIE